MYILLFLLPFSNYENICHLMYSGKMVFSALSLWRVSVGVGPGELPGGLSICLTSMAIETL